MADLVVTGGTVVTAERSFAADVATSNGRISAVGEALAAAYPEAATVDATGLLVLPGCVEATSRRTRGRRSGVLCAPCCCEGSRSSMTGPSSAAEGQGASIERAIAPTPS